MHALGLRPGGGLLVVTVLTIVETLRTNQKAGGEVGGTCWRPTCTVCLCGFTCSSNNVRGVHVGDDDGHTRRSSHALSLTLPGLHTAANERVARPAIGPAAAAPPALGSGSRCTRRLNWPATVSTYDTSTVPFRFQSTRAALRVPFISTSTCPRHHRQGLGTPSALQRNEKAHVREEVQQTRAYE
jgi:hypothetical protein